jgi:DNA-binding NarL/FixJ family response regulator
LIAEGLSNAEIAERLFLSKGTVQNYVSVLFAKLDVTDRTQAAILALRYGLVSRF